ncbi:MAG: hypothetical protein ACRD68_00865, partial [Pyrinomonadaceae bacterium]
MNEGDHQTSDGASEDEEFSGARPLEKQFHERLRSVRSVTERRSLTGLARELGKLPAEAARTALEVSAALAGVSLRVSVEFLRAAPGAALVLEAEEMRAWGEMGRRLAMADVETAAGFFAAGVEELSPVPRRVRPLLFHLCARQMTLSTSIALDTFRRAPELARVVRDDELLGAIFEVALEVARRSAKHSADFLADAPRVASSFAGFGEASAGELRWAAVRLAGGFAVRAGGIAADMWAVLPDATARLSAPQVLALFRHTE